MVCLFWEQVQSGFGLYVDRELFFGALEHWKDGVSLLGAGAFSRAGSVGSWSIGGERALFLGALEH